MSEPKEEIGEKKALYIENDRDYAQLTKSQFGDKGFEMEVPIHEIVFNSEYKLSKTTSYNIRTCILTINGKEIQLKRVESRILRQLCLHINDFVSPEELSMATWGIEKTHAQLHRYISVIRKIIEPNDPSIKLMNKRGAFYLLECKEWKRC